jgi:hypothetical protein
VLLCYYLQKQTLGPHYHNPESSLEALNKWQVENITDIMDALEPMIMWHRNRDEFHEVAHRWKNLSGLLLEFGEDGQMERSGALFQVFTQSMSKNNVRGCTSLRPPSRNGPELRNRNR